MSIKQLGKRAISQTFVGLQRAGVDVLPRHFYSSIPDIRRLRESDRWKAPRSLVGVEGIDTAEQFAFVDGLFTAEVSERVARCDVHENACAEHGVGGYGPVEADVLYAFVRTKRPPKIIQIGAGVSTAVILAAARDASYTPEIIAIDPYPTRYLRDAPVTLIERDAQDVAVDVLADLPAGGLLFIDSTHTVKVDSEVNLLVLEVLPRLTPDTWVHFHDICFPYDYQRDVLDRPLFFWTESTLVHAFLIGNRGYRVAASLSMLHYERTAAMQELIPRYRPAENRAGLDAGRRPGDFPSALYLIRTT